MPRAEPSRPEYPITDDDTEDDLAEPEAEIDPAAGLEAEDLLVDSEVRSGRAASVWAVTKAAVGLIGAPVAVPTMTVEHLRRKARAEDHIATSTARGAGRR